MPHYDKLKTLIASHLEDLENNRLPLISKKTGLSIEAIQEAVAGTAKAQAEAGCRLQRGDRAERDAGRVR